LRTILQLPGAYWESRKILMEFRPNVVIGFGAYASGPVLVAAHFRKIPILLLEPNAVPGFTNRIALRFASKVAVPYEDRTGIFHGKAVVTGTPVRAIKSAPQKNEKLTIGIFGGSQGAHGMNVTIVEALPKLAQMRDQIHLIHQTGKRDFDWARVHYESHAAFFEVVPFIHDVEQFYNRCDLLICRAGAITLAEVTALGKPALLVPLPTSTHNHQEENAKRLEEAGAARMIHQSEFTVDRLISEIQRILASRSELEIMSKASRAIGRPDAAKNVADLALKLCVSAVKK